jgi:hypothetical protein
MNKKELKALAEAAAKNIKSETDLNEFRRMPLCARLVVTSLDLPNNDFRA